jgi:recombination protein RecR
VDSIEKLTSLFERLPGIGPRQAARFVQYLLRSSSGFRNEVANEIQKLGNNVKQCTDCRRFFAGSAQKCTICKSPSRNESLLLVVASDADVDTIERSQNYNGKYFVMGGTKSFGDDQTLPNEKKFLILVSENNNIEEIILGLPANPEGDATEEYIRSLVAAAKKKVAAKISTLGRGLSTGSEIEYADAETLKSALENRH